MVDSITYKIRIEDEFRTFFPFGVTIDASMVMHDDSGYQLIIASDSIDEKISVNEVWRREKERKSLCRSPLGS